MKIRVIISGVETERNKAFRMFHKIGIDHIDFRVDGRTIRHAPASSAKEKIKRRRCHFCRRNIPESIKGNYCSNLHAAKDYMQQKSSDHDKSDQ